MMSRRAQIGRRNRMPPMAARKILQINLKRLQRRRAWRVERPNIPHWRLAEEATVFAVELARAFISDLEGRAGGVQAIQARNRKDRDTGYVARALSWS